VCINDTVEPGTTPAFPMSSEADVAAVRNSQQSRNQQLSDGEPNDSSFWQYKVYADICGVPGISEDVESNDSVVIEFRKRGFSGLSTLRLRHLRK